MSPSVCFKGKETFAEDGVQAVSLPQLLGEDLFMIESDALAEGAEDEVARRQFEYLGVHFRAERTWPSSVSTRMKTAFCRGS